MALDLYNNPEKAGVRRKLWLPRVKQAVARVRGFYPWRDPKYLTFPGPKCLDLHLFVRKTKLFKTENVVAFEVREDAAKEILAEYPTLGRLFRNDYEEIVRSGRFDSHFPFDVVNLDFNGNCFDNHSGGIPRKLRAVERTFQLQGSCYTSFDLFLTFEASYQSARVEGDRDVAKILQDHATRLGFNKGYYRLASRGIRKSYDLTMLETIPSVVIRIGWENGFDTRLLHKAYYTPSGRRSRARLITFVFESTWDYVPLSLPRWEWASRIQPRIVHRQEEALELPVTRFTGSTMRKA